MKSIILLCLLAITFFSATAQEAIDKMTRDRTAGYIDELIGKVKGRKTCDSCKTVFAYLSVFIHDKGIINILEGLKTESDEKATHAIGWSFDPRLIDTMIIKPHYGDMMQLELKFRSKTVQLGTNTFSKPNVVAGHTTTITDHFSVPFLNKDLEKIKEAFLHLKELSIQEKQ